MRRINPISFQWVNAYTQLCLLATAWCAEDMPSSALEELYQLSESSLVTNLQLETDELQEAVYQERFEQAFHALVAKYAEEFAEAKERITDEQMENFLSGRPLHDRFSKVAQQIKTQRAKINERMAQTEAYMKASTSREEKERFTRELIYLAHQAGAWSEELLRRLEERM